MKKKDEELIIEELDINDDIINNLKSFESFVNKLNKKIKSNINFSIVLDNMSNNDIDIYLEYITKIIIEKKLVDEVNEYEDVKNKNNKDHTAIIIKMDKAPYYIRNVDDELMEFIIENISKHNILIFASSKDINSFDSFEDGNILSTLPIYRITNSHTSDEEYNLLLEKYKDNGLDCNISKDKFDEIYENIKDNNYAKSLSITDYLYNYSIISNIKNNKDNITIETFNSIIEKKDKTEEKKGEVKKNFNKLTGLSGIKEEINKLLKYASFKKQINSKDSTYLNLFFLGNPGTGKTMVANSICTKLFEMGYLEYDEVVKIVPNDLIGEYVGQTRRKARNILDKAKGKLLFIDEAYLMYNPNYKDGNNPFMDEAIVELLKYLEDPKNIVIFAGYTKEMRKLYNANPGLKSRIYKEIEFSDYTINELYKILINDLKEQGLNIDKSIKKDLINYINYLKKDKNFGNARSMLKLSQELIMNHALTSDTLSITKEDIPKREDNKNNKRMGFDV